MRQLASSRWLRVGLCVLYAVALIFQLEQGRYDHHHSSSGMVITGVADSAHCNSDHDGAAKHCHTVSIVSLCAPAIADVATLDYPYALPFPPRISPFSGVATRPQFRPPRDA